MRASLNKAIKMAKKIGHGFLATADRTLSPHMSIVQSINVNGQDHLKLKAWFCQPALENLQQNPKISIVVWDSLQDTGYQLAGTMETMRKIAELDGYAAGLEERKHFPQVEWEILVRVERILNFQKKPYIDTEV